MNSFRLTPQSAAERASVSRATIVRALQSHELQGIRGNNGRWSIDPDALDRWTAQRIATVHVQTVNSDQSAALAQLSAQLDSARQQIEAQAARLADLATDRDAWREQAQRLATPPAPATMPEHPRGFRLWRLFRRSN